MRHFGYFMTESTGHLSEYVPWFRKNQKALDLYCDEPAFGGETGAYYKYCAMLAEKFAKTDPLSIESTKLGPRSAEYCSYILEASETGKLFRLNGNVRNDGYITNLPARLLRRGAGLRRQDAASTRRSSATCRPQCAALNMTNVLVQGLAVEAGLTGDPELVMQAVALDPLTAAVCTLKEIREMTAEMLAGRGAVAAAVRGQGRCGRCRRSPIPKNVKRREVPLDPALAIANRFGTLAKA